jgi:hypothetical protein
VEFARGLETLPGAAAVATLAPGAGSAAAQPAYPQVVVLLARGC